MRRFLASASFLLAFFASSAARTQEVVDQAYELAESKDQSLDLAEALRAYERTEALAPLGRHAASAHAHAEYLRTHAEGDFAPLIALERVRRDPARAKDPNALAALGAQSKTFPSGPVRIETWMFLAEAYERAHDDTTARAFAGLVIAEPTADSVSRNEAASLIGEACLRQGDSDCAGAAATADGVSRQVQSRIARLARRRILVPVAALLLFATIAGSLFVLARSRARLGRPRGRALVLPGIAGFVIAAAGVAGGSFEGTTPLPFVLLGTAVFVLSVLGAQVASVVSRGAILRAASFTVALLSAAFLSLYASGPEYLADFGL